MTSIKRFLIATLAWGALAWGALAQTALPTMMAAGGAGAGYTGPGNVVSGALAWYGSIAYSTAVATSGTNNAWVLGRTADAHTCKLLLLSTGIPATTTSGCTTGGDNGTAVATWCAASSGNCFVSTAGVVDQTVNGNSLSGGSPTASTINLSCLLSVPCIDQSVGTANIASVVPSSAIATPLTFVMVYKRTANTGGSWSSVISSFHGVSGQPLGGGGPSANTASVYAGSTFTATATDNAYYIVIGVANGASSVLNVNGTETTGNAGSGVSSLFLTVGNDAIAGDYCKCLIVAAGVWLSAFNSTQRANMCHNLSVTTGLGSC